jgi:hypothetical protein
MDELGGIMSLIIMRFHSGCRMFGGRLESPRFEKIDVDSCIERPDGIC